MIGHFLYHDCGINRWKLVIIRREGWLYCFRVSIRDWLITASVTSNSKKSKLRSACPDLASGLHWIQTNKRIIQAIIALLFTNLTQVCKLCSGCLWVQLFVVLCAFWFQILLKTNRVKWGYRHLDFRSSKGHPKHPPFSLQVFNRGTS